MHVLRQIESRRLLPGARLPGERQMARRFGVSRVSAREAYRALEELGLVAVKRGAGGGAFIKRLDHQAAARSLGLALRLGMTSGQEIQEARRLIEPLVARWAAARASPHDIIRLHRLLAEQDYAARNPVDSPPGRRSRSTLGRPGAKGRLDVQFHQTVAECTRNVPLIFMVHSLLDVAGACTGEETDSAVDHLHSHRRLVSAIERGDGDAAYELMQRHLAPVEEAARVA